MAVSLGSLRRGLARQAVRRASVLLVEVPGGWAVRVAVQQALVARGWREATSPADADALLVCGVPGEGWDEVLERTWAQLPGPRARADVGSVEGVGGVLDALAASLLDDGAQRADAAARDLEPDDLTPGDDMNPGGMELAGGEDDLRDGLEMDVLRVPLGPVLPCWPAGLVLRTVLSGDVVVRADVEVLPGRRDVDAAGDDLARRADVAAQVLTLAGADGLAVAAGRLRDAALAGHDASVEDLRRRVERSRVLRWALRAAGSDVTHDPRRRIMRDVGPEPRADGRDDVRALLLALLDPDAHGNDADRARRTRAALDALPQRLVGVELVTARLLVAALDLRTDALGAADLAALAPHSDDSGDRDADADDDAAADADADAAADADDADDSASDDNADEREHAHG